MVGLNTIMFTGTAAQPINDQGYAVGVDRIRTLLPRLRRGDSHGWFGASLMPVPPHLPGVRDLPPGLFAISASDDTSAADEGVDQVLVTAVAGRPLRSTVASYCEAVAGMESGDSVPLTLFTGPGRKAQTVEVEFE
jgi:S1-C subfamily serine protease